MFQEKHPQSLGGAAEPQDMFGPETVSICVFLLLPDELVLGS